MKNSPSDNDIIFIKHNRENNTFVSKKDFEKHQFEKDRMIRNFEAVEAKFKKAKNKVNTKYLKNIKELKIIKKIHIARLRKLGENKLGDNLE